jgi:hypothetical protein
MSKMAKNTEGRKSKKARRNLHRAKNISNEFSN